MSKLVSVIITTYNRPELFKKALKRLRQPSKLYRNLFLLFEPQFDSVFALSKKQPTWLWHAIYACHESLKAKKLQKYYANLCRDPDFNERYVFFPLNLQPEQSTANIDCSYYNVKGF